MKRISVLSKRFFCLLFAALLILGSPPAEIKAEKQRRIFRSLTRRRPPRRRPPQLRKPPPRKRRPLLRRRPLRSAVQQRNLRRPPLLNLKPKLRRPKPSPRRPRPGCRKTASTRPKTRSLSTSTCTVICRPTTSPSVKPKNSAGPAEAWNPTHPARPSAADGSATMKACFPRRRGALTPSATSTP